MTEEKKVKPPRTAEERARSTCKGLMNKILSHKGLRNAELHIEFMLENPDTQLPTILNYDQTLEVYQKTIQTYKTKLTKKTEKNGNQRRTEKTATTTNGKTTPSDLLFGD